MIEGGHRRAFRILELLVVGCAGWLVSGIANAFVTDAVFVMPDVSAEAASTGKGEHRSGTTQVTKLEALLERNVFGARIAVAGIESEAAIGSQRGRGSSAQGSNFDRTDCGSQDPSFRLVATFASGDPDDALAFLIRASDGVVVAVSPHVELSEGVRIARIDRRVVLAEREGEGSCIKFTMSDESERGAHDVIDGTGRREHAPTKTGPTAHVRNVGPGEFEIRRDEFMAVLGNLHALGSEGRIVPHFDGDRSNGFRLLGLRPNGLYQALGLRNGDVILEINGHRLDDGYATMELYAKLKTESTFVVDFVRDGRAGSHRYSIP